MVFEPHFLAAGESAQAKGCDGSTSPHRRPPRGFIVLDMDSSVSPTHGEQEMSVWNGHYECICYHPLFVFNQFGDLERCVQRPATSTAPTAGRVCSNRSLCGIGARSRGSILPGRCSLRHAGGLRVPGGRADELRDPAGIRSYRRGSAICSSAKWDGRRTKSGGTRPIAPARRQAGRSRRGERALSCRIAFQMAEVAIPRQCSRRYCG